MKSVYSLLRDILSKKVERLEEARVADEKAKAQGRSGFAKLENWNFIFVEGKKRKGVFDEI